MNFGSSGHGGKRQSTFDKLKRSIYPTNRQERERRMRQYRDIGVFVASIVIFTVFEKKIQKLLKVDKSELTQFSNMQQSMHQAY